MTFCLELWQCTTINVCYVYDWSYLGPVCFSFDSSIHHLSVRSRVTSAHNWPTWHGSFVISSGHVIVSTIRLRIYFVWLVGQFFLYFGCSSVANRAPVTYRNGIVSLFVFSSQTFVHHIFFELRLDEYVEREREREMERYLFVMI